MHLCVLSVWSVRTYARSSEYFSPVFTMGEKDMRAGESGTINGDDLRTVRNKVEKVLDVLKHVKMDTFHGPDQIYQRTLWESGEENVGTLAKII